MKLDLYKGDFCNRILGTDGTLNQPFIKPGETELYVFIPELCRSIQWKFVKMVNVNGIPVARHIFPHIKTTQEDPNMSCFCPKDDPMKCDIHGIANLADCFGTFSDRLLKYSLFIYFIQELHFSILNHIFSMLIVQFETK
jgi:hypothetical protein